MRRPTASGLVAVVLLVASLGGLSWFVHPGIPACAPGIGAGRASLSPVRHVFFVIKENHAFENYFGTFPGAIGFPPTGIFPARFGSNATVQPFALTDSRAGSLPNDRASNLADLNGGKNDLFVAQAAALGFPYPQDAVGYYTAAQIPSYFAYAQSYALADDFFSGVLGPTLPNRLFDLGLTGVNWTSNNLPPPAVTSGTTVLDQLSDAGLGWDYYYSGPSAGLAPLLFPSISKNPCMLAHILPIRTLGTQLQGSDPPSVAYVDPSHDPVYSEHPPQNITLGQDWTVAVVNQILSSPVGGSSVILVFFDENGGFWDPVVPPMHLPLGDGFRVPLLVVSPWTPRGLLVHVPLDPASLLQFVENNWNLPYLTPRIANASSISSFFDFSVSPRTPLILSTSVSLDSALPAPVATGGAPHSIEPQQPPSFLSATPSAASSGSAASSLRGTSGSRLGGRVFSLRDT